MEQDAQPHDDQQGDWASNANPESDSSANPTDTAPEESGPKTAAGREMLVQLQQMIDTVTTQAAPVMRDVAAKAAELAAVAGQKAGPLAYKAAEVTDSLGQRMAAKSKDFAAEMRRPPEEATGPASATADAGADAPAAEEAAATTDTTPLDETEVPPATDTTAWS
jgi:hypothetical protein